MVRFEVNYLKVLLATHYAIASAALIENVANVEQLGELDGSEIRGDNYIEWPRLPGQRFAKKLECVTGYQLAYSGKYVACCLPGQKLVGSFDKAWECCGDGHDIAGSKQVGYSCCPTGQSFDGRVCKTPTPPTPRCEKGKVMINGKCACPSGQAEGPDGWCKVGKCDSGLQTGKCYTFTDNRGLQYGYSNTGWYAAAKDSSNHIFGKFQLCSDKECTPDLPVNPGTGVAIRDIHGQANSGANANQWLDNKSNGGHIGKTADWARAGNFTLTKWPCGKYCLGGFDNGLGPTCPSEEPAFTFNTADKQACQPVTVTEVPCDIRAVENNCIWKTGDQCCGRIDCSGVGCDRCYDSPPYPGAQKVLA